LHLFDDLREVLLCGRLDRHELGDGPALLCDHSFSPGDPFEEAGEIDLGFKRSDGTCHDASNATSLSDQSRSVLAALKIAIVFVAMWQ
jgi:hypothetical protein